MRLLISFIALSLIGCSSHKFKVGDCFSHTGANGETIKGRIVGIRNDTYHAVVAIPGLGFVPGKRNMKDADNDRADQKINCDEVTLQENP